MARRLFIPALGMLVCGVGCANPEDSIFLYGRAQDGTGQPLADAPVSLFRSEGEFCSTPIFGRSLAEQLPPHPSGAKTGAVFELFKLTETDRDGRFLFQLLRHELAPFGSDVVCDYRIDVEGGKDGARTSVWWSSMGTVDVYLDRVYRWDDGVIPLEPIVDAHLLSAPPRPLPPSNSARFRQDVVAYEWELTASGKPLWRAEQTASPLLVDGPIREDFAEVEAHGRMLSSLGPPNLEPRLLLGSPGGYFEHARGPAVVLPGIAPRLPASRGAPCSIESSVLDPCPATDGKIDLWWPHGLGVLVIALAAPANPSLAILRDVWSASMITLEGSADGVTWSPLGSLEAPWVWAGTSVLPVDRLSPYDWQLHHMGAGRFFRVELSPRAQPIAWIRVRGVGALRELSIFE